MKLIILLTLLFSTLAFAKNDEPDLKFRFPIADKDRKSIMRWPIFGYDHNPKDHKFDAICDNYKGRGFPNCYDGHKGTDFMLRGGFRKMDYGSATVVAAEAGVVVATDDGHYDRCRASLLKFKVTCKGHPMKPNYVKIRHDNGSHTRYYHLKKGSVLVQPGQRVACGEPIGLIGSSGYSSAPHLHFDVFNKKGLRVDPYAGKKSQSYSFWKKQKDSRGLPGSSCQ